ncbi:DUF29 domain-containing protein [Nibrella viscosa]|uniref:DUF29 domain-containing protein n=1 Tax=Nibrella viscosa TaxID=1084524 RepID=A0ABP8L0V1_9BACT
MKRNWETLTATSYQESVAELREALQNQEFDEVALGLDALYESMSQESRRALKSQLIRLMMHILKWTIQPEKRSRSWALSIENARFLIRDLQEERPSLTRAVIERDFWAKAFAQAKREAAIETGKRIDLDTLSWEAVMETDYQLPIE